MTLNFCTLKKKKTALRWLVILVSAECCYIILFSVTDLCVFVKVFNLNVSLFNLSVSLIFGAGYMKKQLQVLIANESSIYKTALLIRTVRENYNIYCVLQFGFLCT